MTTLLLNGLRAVSVRLFVPWSGAWVAEADFDLAAVPTVPSGPATLKIGDAILVGTIDASASGRFGEKARARVVAGGGGWQRNVSARHFHNDAQVTTAAVIAATAAEIGEVAVVAVPSLLGPDYMRTAGPAARVLAGLDWYVNAAGVTTVGPRVPRPAVPGNIEILEWDPHAQIATLASDKIVEPGTILADVRFGTVTVRDVEQTFGDGGKTRATAWCSPATAEGVSRLATAIGTLVREHARTANLKPYRYRVITQGVDGRLTLQAVKRSAGVPDSIALPVWYGLPGVEAKVVPGAEAIVVFLDGDPNQPAVVGFKGGAVEITIGAPAVKVGEGSSPVARSAELLTWAANVNAALNTLGVPIAPLAPTVASTRLSTD